MTERDQEYFDALQAGDMEVVQRMVDDAAKASGYDSPTVYHGTVGAVINSFSYGPKFFTESRTAALTYGEITMAVKLKEENPIEFNFDGRSIVYFEGKPQSPGEVAARILDVRHDMMEFHRLPDALLEELENLGLAMNETPDAIIMRNINDTAGSFWGTGEIATHHVVFEPSQIKSADLITYDNKGAIIPLSSRFDSQTDDIRGTQVESEVGVYF